MRLHQSAIVRVHQSAIVRVHQSAIVRVRQSAIVRVHQFAIVRVHQTAIVRASVCRTLANTSKYYQVHTTYTFRAATGLKSSFERQYDLSLTFANFLGGQSSKVIGDPIF